MVRIAEQNDWVIFLIVGCIFAYLFMLHSLQRGAGLKEFLLQHFEDSSNSFLSWCVVSVVYCLVFSALFSQYIPVVPPLIEKVKVFGYSLNKFGFTLLSVSTVYLFKTAVSYVFFAGSGNFKKWNIFYFAATKFYFCASLLLMVACVIHYYYPIDRLIAFKVYVPVVLLLVIFKVLYYIFHKNRVLPQQWYYKFLYICTLQIVPYLVLWKVLFF